jgi:predicted dehydrogenase
MQRREFVKRTLAAPAVLGFPTIVPRPVLGAGMTAPSDRIVMGSIGVGSMGTGDLRAWLTKDDVRVVAVCDVSERHRQRAKGYVDARYGDRSCATYNDFRELLARTDIDAVSIAPGERWHALISMEAARRRKHIHCQKPLALTVAEAKALRDAVQRYRVAFLLGAQQRSSAIFRFAVELVRNGRIGQLKTIAIGSAGGGRSALPLGLGFTEMPAERPAPVPPGLDWDMWLGPAPWAPYSDLRFTRTWMSIYDYGLGGIGGEYGVHDVDIGQWANGTDHTTPIAVEGTGELYHDIRDTLTTYEIEYTYANGVRMLLMDLVTARKRFWQFQFGESVKGVSVGLILSGTEGWIWVSRAGIRTHPESLMRTVLGPNDVRVIRSDDHKQNLLDAIRTGAPTVCPVEAGVHDEMICQMGDIAVRMGRKLRWDPVKESFQDDEIANRRLSRVMRSPWRLQIPGAPATNDVNKGA